MNTTSQQTASLTKTLEVCQIANHMQFDDVAIRCPACREKQWLEVDSSEGEVQELIQDCEVCCRPMRIQIRREGRNFRADVALADGF